MRLAGLDRNAQRRTTGGRQHLTALTTHYNGVLAAWLASPGAGIGFEHTLKVILGARLQA
jgi:hypothetical protein